MKREFLMLANKYEANKQSIGGWYASEKLDGIRCLWDGGVTRGMLCNHVPFANTNKDARYIELREATGLWTRYGKPIYAPKWFLDQLPPITLDGELYMGRGMFQTVTSTIKQLNPDERWHQVRYMVFDTPPNRIAFGDGIMDNTNFKKKFERVCDKLKISGGVARPFNETYQYLKDIYNEYLGKTNKIVWEVLKQEALPYRNDDAVAKIEIMLKEIVEQGGEGLMIRHPTSYWVPQRSRQLLKYKPYQDDEGIVKGYYWGKETDKGSKLLGMMGSMIVEWKGKSFELSGFTDQERTIFAEEGTGEITFGSGSNKKSAIAMVEGVENAGKRIKEGFYNPNFPIGSVVTFRFRELSDTGVPKEARYLRKKENF